MQVYDRYIYDIQLNMIDTARGLARRSRAYVNAFPNFHP